MPNKVLLVFVSCPPRRAAALARGLVKDRLAACVNILPAVSSIYRWKNAVQANGEALLLMKTTARRFPALKKAVLERHSYELPEIIAVKLADGHIPYLNWIIGSCE